MRRNSVVQRCIITILSTCFAARFAAAQAPRRVDLDQIAITSLGLQFGHIVPSQVVPTHVMAIQADYGNLAPDWQLVFSASFWQSHFRDDIVQAFADSLHKSLSDPSARVAASRISLYDVSFGGDVRYVPVYSGEIKPFVGFGIAAHVINAEGALINGTFVERALDDIAAGLYVTGGASLKILRHIGIEASARGDLLSGFRSTQIRAGAAYYFGHVRPSEPEPEDNRKQ